MVLHSTIWWSDAAQHGQSAPDDSHLADRLYRDPRRYAAAGASAVLSPCVIQAVLTTISQTIGNWLNSINGVISKIQKLYEQTIWPVNAINLAKTQIQSIITRFRGVIQSIMTINPHTATLPNPSRS